MANFQPLLMARQQPVLTFGATATDTADLTTYTFAAQTFTHNTIQNAKAVIGVYLLFDNALSRNIVSATVGGRTAMVRDGGGGVITGSYRSGFGIIECDLQGLGESLDVVITFNGGMEQCRIFTYVNNGLTVDVLVGTDSSTASPGGSTVSPVATIGGNAIAFGCALDDAALGNSATGGGTATVDSAVTVSSDLDGTKDARIRVTSYRGITSAAPTFNLTASADSRSWLSVVTLAGN
jgi:hypothetical protein